MCKHNIIVGCPTSSVFYYQGPAFCLQPPGASCRWDEHCRSGVCVDDECQAGLVVDELPCEKDVQCASGTCAYYKTRPSKAYCPSGESIQGDDGSPLLHCTEPPTKFTCRSNNMCQSGACAYSRFRLEYCCPGNATIALPAGGNDSEIYCSDFDAGQDCANDEQCTGGICSTFKSSF